MHASPETIQNAKKNMADIFKVEASGVTFDAVGSDRASVGGLSAAQVDEGRKYDLQRALHVAFGGGQPTAEISEHGHVMNLTFTHGDLDGTLNAIANINGVAKARLTKEVSGMKPGQDKGRRTGR